MPEISLKLIMSLLLLAKFLGRGDTSKKMEANRLAKVALMTNLSAREVVKYKVSPPAALEGNVHISSSIGLSKFVKVEESSSTLELSILLRMQWIDLGFAWDTKQYANVSSISLPVDSIWHPNIHIFNVGKGQSSLARTDPSLQIFYNGTVLYTDLTSISAHCPFDLQFFPFDSQLCPVWLRYDGQEVDIKPTVTLLDMQTDGRWYFDEGSWVVTKAALTHLQVSNIQVEQVSFTMDRNSGYYLILMVMPLVATSILRLLVFWIHPASQFKLTYLTILFLATIVLLVFIGFSLPRNMSSRTVPRIALCLIYVMMESILCIFVTNVVMRVYYEEQVLMSELQDLQKVAAKDVAIPVLVGMGGQVKKVAQEIQTNVEELQKTVETQLRTFGVTIYKGAPYGTIRGVNLFKILARRISSTTLDIYFFICLAVLSFFVHTTVYAV